MPTKADANRKAYIKAYWTKKDNKDRKNKNRKAWRLKNVKKVRKYFEDYNAVYYENVENVERRNKLQRDRYAANVEEKREYQATYTKSRLPTLDDLTLPPYNNCVLGKIHTKCLPKHGKKYKSLYVWVHFKSGAALFMPYARYLYEIKVGRYLTDDEFVYSLDGNSLNVNPDNLVSLYKEERKWVGRRFYNTVEQTITCQYCGKDFKLSGLSLAKRKGDRDKGKPGSYCSRTCGGKAAAEGFTESAPIHLDWVTVTIKDVLLMRDHKLKTALALCTYKKTHNII